MAKQKCPRCSGEFKRISGFIKCSDCDYVLGSQNLNTDWSQFDDDLGRTRAKDADKQNRIYKGDYPRRRYPLRFED